MPCSRKKTFGLFKIELIIGGIWATEPEIWKKLKDIKYNTCKNKMYQADSAFVDVFHVPFEDELYLIRKYISPEAQILAGSSMMNYNITGAEWKTWGMIVDLSRICKFRPLLQTADKNHRINLNPLKGNFTLLQFSSVSTVILWWSSSVRQFISS